MESDVKLTSTRWEYSLTQSDEATCARIGFERQLPYLGNPKANRNYSMGDADEIFQHIVACGSELAFARMMGMNDFEPHVNKWNTEQDVPGFEIRYCFTQQREDFEHGLRLHSRDKNDNLYVLITGGLETRKRRSESDDWVSHPYKAVGWIYGLDGRIPDNEAYYGGWRVPMSKLRPMRELEDAGW